MVVLTEFGGTAPFLLLEDAVEVAQVVEAASIAYLGNGMGAVDQHPAGMA